VGRQGLHRPQTPGGPAGMRAGPLIEIVHKPKAIKGVTVLYRRWVVERTFAWMARCRRLAKDVERTVASSLAWVPRTACRFRMRRVARGAQHESQ